MEPWQLAILLKPFGLVAFLLLVAVLALPIRRALPKSFLTDPTFRHRHPYIWTAIILAFYAVFISSVAIWTTRL